MVTKKHLILLGSILGVICILFCILTGTRVICISHEWLPATCTEPKTCRVCGDTMGAASGHTPGMETKSGDYYIAGYYTTIQKCRVCNSTLNEGTYTYDTFILGNRFALTPSQFISRLHAEMSGITGFYGSAGIKQVDGETCGIIWDYAGSAAVAFSFFGAGSDDILDSAESKNMRGAVGFVYDYDYLTYALIGMIRAADPSISFETAKDVGKKVLAAADKGDYYEHDGIRYSIISSGGITVLGMVVAE